MIPFEEAARRLLDAVFPGDVGSDGRGRGKPLGDRRAARVAGLALCLRCRRQVRAVPRPGGRGCDLADPGLVFRAEVESVCSTAGGPAYRDWGQDRAGPLWDGEPLPAVDVPHQCDEEG